MIGLGERRAQVGQRLHRLHALLQQRHAAEHRQPELGLDVRRLADRLVHGLEQERQDDPERQAGKAGDRQVVHRLRPRRRTRRTGPVDDGDVVGGDAAGDADLLVAVQQAIVERLGGIHLALQDVVLDLAVALVEHGGLLRIQLRLQLVHLRLRRVILGPQRTADGLRRRRELLGDVIELLLQLHHVRIVRLIDLQLLVVLDGELDLVLPQLLDGRVAQQIGRGEARGGLRGPIASRRR